MKCPLCDGTVANGRCTFCGMPYRNDAVLYHLNERPSEHYRHADPKARAVMRSQHNTAGANAIGKNASKADIKAHQEQVRKDAVKRMTTTKNPGTRHAGPRPGHQTHSPKNILTVIILLIIILFSVLPGIMEIIFQYL